MRMRRAGTTGLRAAFAFGIGLAAVTTLGGTPAQAGSCPASGNVIHGTNGNDKIVGTECNDIILAADGNDVVYGNGGDDQVYAGRGADTVYGGFGHDYIVGNAGDDTLSGFVGNDTITGRGGADRIDGESGDDKIYGDLHGATEDTGYGDDNLTGGTGTDQVFGQEGHDLLFDPDAGVLNGGSGNDVLKATTGGTVLSGGYGNDSYFTRNGAVNGIVEILTQGYDVVWGDPQDQSYTWNKQATVEKWVMP